MRKGLVLLLVAAISLCMIASDCGESAEIEFGYSFQGGSGLPQWTPDGTRIAVELGRGIIFVIDADGSNLIVLNDHADNRNRNAHSPSISPDGSQVVYSQRLKTGGLFGGKLNYELVLKNLDGSNGQRLTEDAANDIVPAWSPDGSRIAFLSDRLSLEDLSDDLYLTDFTLFTMAPDGSDVRSLGANVIEIEAAPIWSPDGRYIAFLNLEEKVTGDGHQMVVYVVGSDGSNLQRLSETTSVPAWSPDSKSIAFLNVSEENDTVVLYDIDVHSSEQREIVDVLRTRFNGRAFPFLYWSPDGSEIRFGSYPFIIARADGSNYRIFRHLYPKHAVATWSPDWSKVAVLPRFGRDDSASEQDREVALFVMSPDGSEKRVLIREAGSGKYKEGKGERWSPDYVR